MIQEFINLNKTIAKEIIIDFKYPNVLNIIFLNYLNFNTKNFNYIKSKNTYIHKTVKKEGNVFIGDTCLIDKNTEIRHGAYIRNNNIIGKNCLIGHCTEVKNSILCDDVSIPHFNFIGDSILGYKVHLGAGAITANLRLDKKDIKIRYNNIVIDSKKQLLGCVIGDYTEIGCNVVINPGELINRYSKISK